MIMTISSIVIEVIRTAFIIIIFLLWTNFKHLKHKQKRLKKNKPKNINKSISSNFQPDIKKKKLKTVLRVKVILCVNYLYASFLSVAYVDETCF